MKTCPHCQRTFPDEYSFCLTDGTPLVGVPDLTEEPTVIRERPVSGVRKSRSILVFVLAALLSLSLGITAAVLYFFWPRQPRIEVAANNIPSATSPSPKATVPTPSPSPERVRREPTPPSSNSEATNQDQGDEDARVPREAPDPGPTRIVFRPGRVEETVAGSVNDRRSYMLYARAGQQLTARISSPDDCVNFDTGDSSVRYTTDSGNNSLTILNSCDRPAPFRLRVSIK